MCGESHHHPFVCHLWTASSTSYWGKGEQFGTWAYFHIQYFYLIDYILCLSFFLCRLGDLPFPTKNALQIRSEAICGRRLWCPCSTVFLSQPQSVIHRIPTFTQVSPLTKSSWESEVSTLFLLLNNDLVTLAEKNIIWGTFLWSWYSTAIPSFWSLFWVDEGHGRVLHLCWIKID